MSNIGQPGEHYVPDYEHECQNCGQTPVVTIVDENDEVIENFEMCGPCLFGEAACLDPKEW